MHRPLADIYADLARPIPREHLATKKVPTKKGSSYEATYVNHATLRDLLDAMAPGWEWSTSLWYADGNVYVIGTLTIVGNDGRVSRDGIGNADAELDGYGDPSSNADAMAMRRAAMAHGLGRELWRKEGHHPPATRPAAIAPRQVPNGNAPTRPPLTDAQKGAADALRARGITGQAAIDTLGRYGAEHISELSDVDAITLAADVTSTT